MINWRGQRSNVKVKRFQPINTFKLHGEPHIVSIIGSEHILVILANLIASLNCADTNSLVSPGGGFGCGIVLAALVISFARIYDGCYDLRPLTHAPETGFRNRRHKFDARCRRHFSCRCTTSNVVDCLRSSGPEGSQRR